MRHQYIIEQDHQIIINININSITKYIIQIYMKIKN